MIEKRTSILSVITRKSIQLKTVSTKQWPQILASLTANLCFFSAGLHMGWSSPSIPQLTSENYPLSISDDEISWIVTSQPLGDFIGAAVGAYLSNRIGRKKTILFTTIPQLIAWLMIAFPPSAIYLIIARFISGISEGAIYICVPIYLGEILEPKIRGRLGAASTTIIIVGIATINVIGSQLSIQNTALIASSVPIITIIMFSVMPESPYYSLMKSDRQQAERNLKFLRRIHDVNDELESINTSVQSQMKNPTTFKILFTDRANRKALIIMALTRMVQQGCGISSIMYFLIPIFNLSGLALSSVTATLIYSAVQVTASFICTGIVDKVGRKPLLLISVSGATVALGCLSAFFYCKENLHYDITDYNLIPLFVLLGFALTYNVGYGTIPNLLLSEFFPANVKTKALFIMQYILAIMFFAQSKLFLILLNNYGTFFPFLLFTCSAFAGIFFTYFCVPETNGKTLQEIQDWFNR